MHVSIRIPKYVLVLGAVLLATLWTWGVASAVGGSGGPNGIDTSDAPKAPVVKAALEGGASEVYTGIKPCRILDTRLTSTLTNSQRNFKVSGDLTAQGGATNCGIPTNASSVVVNLTGIAQGPNNSGYVRGWAFGGSMPNATLLNFSKAINASNQVNIPLCRGGGCTSAFHLRAFGSADIVGDAVGYYTPPMYALINSDGTADGTKASGLVSSTRTGTGQYTLVFDRDVRKCTVQTTDFLWIDNRDISPDNGGGGGNVVIQVRGSTEALEDTVFYVNVTC